MRVILIFFSAILVLGTSSCKKADTTGQDLALYSEILKPYNYPVNGNPAGIVPGLVNKILGDFGLTNPITFSSNWDSLFNLLSTSERTMLFTTGLTAERKTRFKWVGPVAVWHTAFVALVSSGMQLAHVEDAKKLPAIGVVSAYSSVEVLLNLGFTNLVYFNTLGELVENLYNGTVKVIFDDPGMFHAAAVDQFLDHSQMHTLLIHSSTAGYLAFSRDVSDRIIESWQEKVDELKDSGFLQGLFDEYLPGTQAPGRILIFAEENPPQSYRDAAGNLTGSSTEMVKAMLGIIGMTGEPEYTSWTNAYDQIRLVPNSMAFTTLRSAERESLFHWVGPLCKKRYCFYARASDESDISTIDAARRMQSVGTVTGWASEKELIDRGFNNVVTWSTPQEVLRKLMDGDIQCAVLNDISMRLLGTETGHPPKDYRKGAVLSEGQTYIAFSIDTDDQYVKSWTEAYNTLVSTGRLAEIWHRWYPDIDW